MHGCSMQSGVNDEIVEPVCVLLWGWLAFMPFSSLGEDGMVRFAVDDITMQEHALANS